MKNNILDVKINKKQATDAGMALVLIFLLIGLFSNNIFFYKICIPILILVMIFPMITYPFAILWFNLAKLSGTIISKILLIIIFFVIVLPVAVIRRMAGKDTLRLKQFKKSTDSVMQNRDKWFSADDLITPY